MNSIIKLILRDWQHGKLNLLLASLVVGVATVTAIALFASRIQNSILDEATQILAGDAQIRGSYAIPQEWIEFAHSLNIQTAQTTRFRAMAFSETGAQLASVRAVSNRYPLKSHITVSAQAFGEAQRTQETPKTGEAWINSRLFALLGLNIGETLDIGEKTFTVTQALIKEPDQSASMFNTAPRILISQEDVDATGAVQTGSRIEYNLIISGENTNIEQFKTYLQTRLGNHHRWVSVETANQNIGRALERANTFLYLAGSISVLLSGVAVALASRRYALKQARQVGLLKTLGYSPRKIVQTLCLQMLLITTFTIAVGCFVGWCLHWGIAELIRPLVPYLAPPSFKAYFLGAITGCIASAGFSAPAILSLKNITPLAAFRQSYQQSTYQTALAIVCGFLSIFCLILLYTRDLTLTLIVCAGLICSAALTGLVARLLSKLLAKILNRSRYEIRLGLASFERHARLNTGQIILFSILFTLVISLILVRTTLISTWQKQLPEDAPNHFMFNIFANEKPKIEAFFEKHQLTTRPYYPMTRGRILGVNGRDTDDLLPEDHQGINYERELNLTWAQELGADNKITEGTWWTGDEGELSASIEEAFAKGLNIQIGDTIELSLAGQKLQAKVQSLRSVQWDSMNPNFFIIFDREFDPTIGSNWLTSFYLPPNKKLLVNELLSEYPTVTLIELEQTISQLQSIINKVSRAIEFIWALVMVAGVLVLISGIQSTLDARIKEGTILRVIGSSRSLLRSTLITEFVIIGLIAGFMACLSAELAVYLLQSQLLNLPYFPHLWLWLVGPMVTSALIVAIGLVSTRKVLQTPPMSILRAL